MHIFKYMYVMYMSATLRSQCSDVGYLLFLATVWIPRHLQEKLCGYDHNLILKQLRQKTHKIKCLNKDFGMIICSFSINVCKTIQHSADLHEESERTCRWSKTWDSCGIACYASYAAIFKVHELNHTNIWATSYPLINN